MNLDLSKTSGPDCIPVVVLKNCKPELSYIVADFFNKCLREGGRIDHLPSSFTVKPFPGGFNLV